jgi:hypothetical protein
MGEASMIWPGTAAALVDCDIRQRVTDFVVAMILNRDKVDSYFVCSCCLAAFLRLGAQARVAPPQPAQKRRCPGTPAACAAETQPRAAVPHEFREPGDVCRVFPFWGCDPQHDLSALGHLGSAGVELGRSRGEGVPPAGDRVIGTSGHLKTKALPQIDADKSRSE